MLRGIHASMLGEYVRAATWRRAVRALAGGYCAPSRATFRERGIHGNFFRGRFASGAEHSVIFASAAASTFSSFGGLGGVPRRRESILFEGRGAPRRL